MKLGVEKVVSQSAGQDVQEDPVSAHMGMNEPGSSCCNQWLGPDIPVTGLDWAGPASDQPSAEKANCFALVSNAAN